MVGREAALLGVAVEDSREVERLAHRVADEMREVPWRDELVHRGRQKPALIDIPAAKDLGHGPRKSPRNRAVQSLTQTGS
jgi:hypothetical protein